MTGEAAGRARARMRRHDAARVAAGADRKDFYG